MEAELATAAIVNYAFVEAVDGKTLQLTPALAAAFKGNDYGSRKAVMGCALSHYYQWQALLADADNAYYIIFEDDVHLCADFMRKLQRVLAQGAAYDVIFLSYTMSPSVRKTHGAYWATADDCTVRALDKSLYIGGTMAYYVSKAGARKMLDYCHADGMKYAIDSAMVFGMPSVSMGECFPFLASTDSEDNSDTDIGRVLDAFDL